MDAKNNVRTVSSMFRTKAPLVLICAALAGAMILIFARSGGSETTVSGESVGTYYSEELERRVDELVLSLAGIDSVTSIVTLDGSGEYKYAKNERGVEGDAAYSADYLVIGKKTGDEALLVKEMYPQIRGIAVVCTDGDSSAVREKVTRLLAAAFGVSANKIEVAGT